MLAFLGGAGAYVTACTPLLLGLAKVYADKRASKAPDAADNAAIVYLLAGMFILAGGLFFTYLLWVFAVALLVFICAFMLTSSVMVLALAHAYETVNLSVIERERLADARAKQQAIDKVLEEAAAAKTAAAKAAQTKDLPGSSE